MATRLQHEYHKPGIIKHRLFEHSHNGCEPYADVGGFVLQQYLHYAQLAREGLACRRRLSPKGHSNTGTATGLLGERFCDILRG